MSSKENEDERREQGKHSRSSKNKAQLKGFLEEMKENYRRDTIEAVLTELPGPPPEGPETDTQELMDILNTYTKAFGPELFWAVISELGLRPKKEVETSHSYGLCLMERDDVVALNVIAQNIRTIKGENEWHVKIVEDGYVKLFLKDKGEPQSIDVKVGDIIQSTGNLIIIQNLSKPITVSTSNVTSPSNTIIVPATP